MVAFLGTGLLGGAFAEAAAKRGDSVAVWNRTMDKATALEVFGVRAMPTPADAVKGASRVHLVLKDDAVVNEVIEVGVTSAVVSCRERGGVGVGVCVGACPDAPARSRP